MTTFAKLFTAILITLATACGTETSSTTSTHPTPSYLNEYDPNASSHVIGWKIEQTFRFDADGGSRRLSIQNVDAVTEGLQIYIGSGKRPRYHVYVTTAADFGSITDRLQVIDRLQPNKVRADYAIKVGQNPNGDFVYRLSLPVEAPYRSEIYAEMVDFDGTTHWSNEGTPQSFKPICYQNYLPR